MKQNILIVKICKELLHDYEFVKPIEDILNKVSKSNNKTLVTKKTDSKYKLASNNSLSNNLVKDKIKFFTKHYKELTQKDLDKSSRIIICGTSLKDFDYFQPNNLKHFEWVKNCKKPLLGICGGMHIISAVFDLDRQVKRLNIKNNFDHILKKQTEIGYYEEEFNKEFLGMKDKVQVYHLHNNYTTLQKNFTKYNKGKISQAIKHKSKPIYGVLFHPEVRNKKMILNFVGFKN